MMVRVCPFDNCFVKLKNMSVNYTGFVLTEKAGEKMLAEDHYNNQSIRRKALQVQSRWSELQRKMAERGNKLRQAGQQEQLMELLQVLHGTNHASIIRKCY